MREAINELRYWRGKWGVSTEAPAPLDHVFLDQMYLSLIAVMERIEAMDKPSPPAVSDNTYEPRTPEDPAIEAARTELLEYAGDTDCDPESMAGFADALIAACKREQPPTVAWTGDVGSGRITSIGRHVIADVERAAKIKALRWVLAPIEGGLPVPVSDLYAAISRLESGGDL